MLLPSTFPALSQADQKRIRALQKRSGREEQRLCVLEGEHLCMEYIQYCRSISSENMIRLHTVVVPMDELPPQIVLLTKDLAALGGTVYTTSPQKFALLCDTATPQRILAVIDLPEQPFFNNSPLLILDSVADPGNVGTIIRTADWFGVRNILLGEGSADRFSPKALRSTMGSIFRTSVHSVSNLATVLQTSFADYTLWGASLQGAITLEALRENILAQKNSRYGIVMGNEARGISPDVQQCLAGMFKIRGGESGAESLNVAIATGIVLHELSH
jgi:TrmH family RNA methyltransferase